MKAVILAAGRGSRLRPLTDHVPKPMIPISGRPLLEHTLRLLSNHGFDDLIINLHHLPDTIRSHFGDGREFGVRLDYAHEPQLQGTAGAIREIDRTGFFEGQDFLVYYGDNLINADLSALWNQHLNEVPDATIGLVRMPDPQHRGIVGLDETGHVDRLIERPTPEEVFDDYYINAGVYGMGQRLLETIPATGTPDFAADLFPEALQKKRPLVGHPLRGQLLSTDTPERYRATCEQVAAGHFTLP
ncbi:MAG: nucleotidyltransferase family protein [Gemmatimonadetes bacterium]|jgi:mannose-1-phosphate guanylyltransferase / phosphomannomutase|nr:nucleotidyltransferase family protein [Gemmatimonadota bacterium]MBT6148935.1 nucleotidyltransferase family protein [Gemmatimonadota bacterium]MBT7860074.1 nucleotidyltransferase family protein [Gemmatimonadota bacterium]